MKARRGQGLAEYMLIVVLISLVGIAVLKSAEAERERLYAKSVGQIAAVAAAD